MALTAKTAHDTERQRLFESIRHLVSSKHQCPEWLTHSDLLAVLATLLGEKR
jgi:hypothetical protein